MNQVNNNLNIVAMIKLFWSNKLFIIFFTSIFAISSVFLALSLPPIYSSSVVLKSVQENQADFGSSLGVLSGFNNLKGSLGLNPDEEAILAIKHAYSKDFFKVLYRDEEFKKNLLAYDYYDSTSKSNFYDKSIYNSDENKWLYEAHFLTAHKKFTTQHMNISQDKIGDFVNITIEHKSPIIAAQWAELVYKEINAYMKKITYETTSEAVEYIKSEIGSTTSTELKKVLASSLESKIQKLMYADISDDYIFSVVDSAYVANERVRPSRSFICIVITALGFLIACSIIFIVNEFKSKLQFRPPFIKKFE
tara:strand:- start:20087 stop:21007 length:921 start_codon:yes stop_codon:yes gene_type:complete